MQQNSKKLKYGEKVSQTVSNGRRENRSGITEIWQTYPGLDIGEYFVVLTQ